jgi:preprotein translocase subunit YajC
MLNAFFFFMGDPSNPNAGIINLVFMGAIFAVMYFLIIRPQAKKQKELAKKVAEMKKGDRIVTNGGMLGVLESVDNDTVLVAIDSGVKARFLKSAIADVNPNTGK